ncbi:MAG TPA: hydroxymethylbilane synthase [Dissulfurispiraceae bacterium]|nr:hydroxymethylbilane synthase [Dissulfurispiraceae bacterium]
MTTNKRIVIGTRGSRLALWQAEWVKSGLQRLHPDLTVDLNIIKTTGDKILDVPLALVGGKGLFVKEIEEAMLRGEADIAVHSMKDVPTDFPVGLHLAVICKREDPHDAFIAPIKDGKPSVASFRGLPMGARIGTSSLRRACQLRSIRPDLQIGQLRGNLDSRFRKLDEGKFDAIILAVAGVKRLGMGNRITEVLHAEVSLPAIGQGAVGIECRIDDPEINALIAPLNHTETSLCVRAERALLKRLEGGCQVPIAAHAEWKNSALHLDGLVGSVSGDCIIRQSATGSDAAPEALGIALADILLQRGAKRILDEVYSKGMH